MTDAEKLAVLRKMYAGTEGDDILLAYLQLAGQRILRRAFPYRDDVADVPSRYSFNQIEIACYLLNKIGAEGQIAHDENGVHRTYADASVPETMLFDITPEAGVP